MLSELDAYKNQILYFMSDSQPDKEAALNAEELSLTAKLDQTYQLVDVLEKDRQTNMGEREQVK